MIYIFEGNHLYKKKEELHTYSCGRDCIRISQFYWYNGELLAGRIVMGDADKWSMNVPLFYFMTSEHYDLAII